MININTACLLLSMLGVLTGCGGDVCSGGVKSVPVADVDSSVYDYTYTDTVTYTDKDDSTVVVDSTKDDDRTDD
ncbi:hypothetical protein ACSTI2_00105, partial [Vibrio parahaemolyticus]